MRMRAGFGVVCATLLVAGPALATTVTNQDMKSHTVVVDLGAKESRHDIAAGQSMKFDCPERCGFRDLALGTSRTADNNAQLVIDKDAELHFKGGQGDYLMKDGSR